MVDTLAENSTSTLSKVEDADLTKYLKDDGSVDTAKVEAKVKALAPEKPEGNTVQVESPAKVLLDRINALQAERVLGQSLQVPELREEILDELVNFVLIGAGLNR